MQQTKGKGNTAKVKKQLDGGQRQLNIKTYAKIQGKQNR